MGEDPKMDEFTELFYGSGREAGKEVKITGWGREDNLLLGAVANPVSCTAGGEGGNYTVQISAQDPPGVNAPRVTQALIRWSAGGTSTTRRVTVGSGVTIQGTCESVKVTVIDATVQQGGGPVPNGAPYKVQILITRGTRAASPQPPTYAPVPSVFLILAGGAQSIAIPGDAGITSVAITCAPRIGGSGPIVEGNCQAIQSQGSLFLKAYDPRDYPWVPLAPGADTITLSNPSTADQYWSVLFGVDG